CRSNADMRDMMKWADDTGKKLVFLVDGLTYDPAAGDIGRIVNDVLITFIAAMAEMESFNTSVRTTSLHAYRREKKSCQGGHLPLGYDVKKEGGRKILVRSERTHPVFMEIVNRILNRESVGSIVADFNQRGVYTPRNWSRVLQGVEPRRALWSISSVHNLFESDVSLGYRTRPAPRGRGPRVTDRDDDGNPVQLWEPLIDKDTLRAVRAAIADRAITATPFYDRKRNPLLGVAKCYECGANLSWQKEKPNKTLLRCYKAAKKGHPCQSTARIPIDIAWTFLEEFFLHRHGDRPVVEGRYVKSEPTDSGLSALQDEWAAVSEQSIRARSQTARE